MKIQKHLLSILCMAIACSVCTPAPAFAASDSSDTKIHFLTLPEECLAVLVECNGQFGMIDSGEDTDYPDGSDDRYPLRPNIRQDVGYEDDVISYLESAGVTDDNFEFYIGTHVHSDHIGTADEVIRAFHPKRVYTPEYHDYCISSDGNLWDNLFNYDNMLQAAVDTGAEIILNFDPAAPVYPSQSTGAVPDTVQYTKSHPKISIPATDIVDPSLDVYAAQTFSDYIEGPKEGRFEEISSTRNTTGCPDFTLGEDLDVHIMNYQNDHLTNPTGDANNFSLGVLLESNDCRMFVAGDINNYYGQETVLASQLGHVDLLCLGHHGYYGSNTYGYVKALSPDVLVLPGTFHAVTDATETEDEVSTFSMLMEMGENGVPLYPAALFDNITEAITFEFDSGLTTNIPEDITMVYETFQTATPSMIYYHNGLPEIHTGYVSTDAGSFYFDNSMFGTSADHWKNFSGRWCYYYNDTDYAYDCWMAVNNDWYFFDYYGYMSTGWEYINNSWYHFNNIGAMNTGWLYNNSAWYYSDNSGVMQTGWLYDNDNWYYFDNSGVMHTGWLYDNGAWYYFGSDGSMHTGWLYDNGAWYYFDDSGVMHTGWLYDNGTWYYLNSSGSIYTGWLYDNENWYYFNTSGQMMSGWQYINDHWYHFASDGHMLG